MKQVTSSIGQSPLFWSEPKMPDFPADWAECLFQTKELQAAWNTLQIFYHTRQAEGATIYPSQAQILNAFYMTPFEKVKVVIIGQDPYHGEGQAMGLAFSVPPGVALPPSLKNIYKELESDLDLNLDLNAKTQKLCCGDLSDWAQQGVFLLNTVLTVEARRPASHQGQGWEIITDEVFRQLSLQREHLVFILWGGPAQAKRHLIDKKKHLILEAPHPSPLSSWRGFFGSKPFSKANDYLKQHGLGEISWVS